MTIPSFEEISFRYVSSNINCADIYCIKLIIVNHIHNNHIVYYICLVYIFLNFCPYVFICNPLHWIFTKIVHNSSKIFFGDIKSNIFEKVFDDGAKDNSFGWKDYLRSFSFYFLFQNKIETDIYIFLYNIIRYFSYESGSTLLFCDNNLYDDDYYNECSRWFFCCESSSSSSFSVSIWSKPSEHII